MAARKPSKARASITAGPGPFHYGDTVPLDALVASWSGSGFASYWARYDASQGSLVVAAQVERLDAPGGKGAWTFGPTPLYQGGPASGVLTLYGYDGNGVEHPLASTTFDILA